MAIVAEFDRGTLLIRGLQEDGTTACLAYSGTRAIQTTSATPSIGDIRDSVA